ncbi:VOC family protein [Nocardiopsis potens]|uniref:VOC family protein n=1 Tax=Nocardiopsis potens TaxID=1246458 RepID=UPI00034B95D1|nr:VOC family protein [Nocardiopsis potens]
MAITHARLIALPVVDQDRARDFYVGVLGFTVLADRTLGHVRWLQVAPPGAGTGFVLTVLEQGFTQCGTRGITLESDDLDGDCARLAAAGVEVEGPDEHPWGREAGFSDPDGNAFVLAEPAAGGA